MHANGIPRRLHSDVCTCLIEPSLPGLQDHTGWRTSWSPGQLAELVILDIER
jgi:hypothetical protein